MTFFLISGGFRSSRSTAHLLIVVSDRIARAFNRSGATQAVALDISKAFDKVWHASQLHKLMPYGISGQIFGLISSFLRNRQLQLVLDGKISQKYPVNAGVPQGPFLALHFSCCILMTSLIMLSVILLSISMILTLVDVLQNWLSWFHFFFLEVDLLVILIGCMIFLSPFLDVTRMSLSTVSFLTQLNSAILCL